MVAMMKVSLRLVLAVAPIATFPWPMTETVKGRSRTRRAKRSGRRQAGCFLKRSVREECGEAAGEETGRAPLRGRATGSDVAMTGKDADGRVTDPNSQEAQPWRPRLPFTRQSGATHQIPLADVGQSRSSVMSRSPPALVMKPKAAGEKTAHAASASVRRAREHGQRESDSLRIALTSQPTSIRT